MDDPETNADTPTPDTPTPAANQPDTPAPAADAPAPEAERSAIDSVADTVEAAGRAAKDAAGSLSEPAEDVADATADIAEATAEGAAGLPDDAADGTVRLLNDLQDISFGRIALIVLAAWAAIAVSKRLLPYLAERSPSGLRLYLLGTVPILRLMILVAAVLWIVPLVFNVTFENFLVIAGAASVALGFAFKDYASSLIAGIVAIIERPYRPGDWVRIDGVYGEVVTVGMRAIRLRTPADDIVAMPHDKIWTSAIANSNDGARTLLCVAEFTVRPGHDAAALRAALRDVARTSAFLDYGRPAVVMLEPTPAGTRYKVKAYPFDMRDQFAFVSDLTVRGKQAIEAAGAGEASVGVIAAG